MIGAQLLSYEGAGAGELLPTAFAGAEVHGGEVPGVDVDDEAPAAVRRLLMGDPQDVLPGVGENHPVLVVEVEVGAVRGVLEDLREVESGDGLDGRGALREPALGRCVEGAGIEDLEQEPPVNVPHTVISRPAESKVAVAHSPPSGAICSLRTPGLRPRGPEYGWVALSAASACMECVVFHARFTTSQLGASRHGRPGSAGYGPDRRVASPTVAVIEHRPSDLGGRGPYVVRSGGRSAIEGTKRCSGLRHCVHAVAFSSPHTGRPRMTASCCRLFRTITFCSWDRPLSVLFRITLDRFRSIPAGTEARARPPGSPRDRLWGPGHRTGCGSQGLRLLTTSAVAVRPF